MLNNMNLQTNTGYGTQHERMGRVSIEQPYTMPKSGSFIMRHKHGLWNHPLYQRWTAMKQRCYNKNSPQYPYYGARGITVCAEWKYSFEVFFDYVMSSPYAMKDGLSIDRIDNNGNYEPGNIRWVNGHIQTTNRGMLANNTSGYIGVSKHYDKYRSSICVNGKIIRFGRFHTKEEALNARNQYIIDNNLFEYQIQ